MTHESETPKMVEAPDADLVGWEVRPNVSHQALYNMLECVMEIAQALRGLANGWQPGTVATSFVSSPLMVSTARKVSTSIRKLLLDGNGSLLKRCVADLDIHPLKPPHRSPFMNFIRHFDEQRFTLGWADGVSRDITVPALDHTTTIHPLYGVRHIGEIKFGLYNPFDHDADPIKFQKWMNIRVIEIDGHQFRAEQLLRDMSNKEGAHIEDNQALMVPEDLNIDKDKNTLHRLTNGVRFGSMTYLQIFSLFTGLYLVNRTRGMLKRLPFPADNQAVFYICEVITQSPRSITTGNADIQFNSYPLAVLGHDRALRGDYSSGIQSTFKVPE